VLKGLSYGQQSIRRSSQPEKKHANITTLCVGSSKQDTEHDMIHTEEQGLIT